MIISKPPLLFLSHAGEDAERAVALARAIEAIPAARDAGLRVWVDKRPDGSARLFTGTPWLDQLEEAITKQATAFAVLVTPQGVRNWVRMEVRAALIQVVDAQREGQRFPFIPLVDGGEISDLPPFAQVYQCLFIDSAGQWLGDLVAAVLDLKAGAPVPLIDEPFRGLQAFEADHAALFFGRETETADLVRHVRDHELLLVTGDSGAGKSSLVKAGLIPAWREGLFAEPLGSRPDPRLWHVVEMNPDLDPFEGLVEGAINAGLAAGIEGADLLAIGDSGHGIRSQNGDRVRDALQLARPKGAKLLLVVDQLEELWTRLRDGVRRNAFLDVLLALTSPGNRDVRVVATLRRDYLHLHSDHEGLRARWNQPGARFLLSALSPAGLQSVVVKPLRLAGIDGPDPDILAKAIAQDVLGEPGNLALVEMALSETWQRRGEHRTLLEAYQQIGRLEGALATAAADVYWNENGRPDWLDDIERALAEALFMRLARLGDHGGATRRAARRDELDNATWQVAVKLSTPACRRLVVVRGGETAGDAVELAHEQLITQWPDYRHWLWGTATTRHPRPDLQRETDKRLLDRLIDRSALWGARGRNESDLAQGLELQELADLRERRGSWLSAVERIYIDTGSEAQAARQRRQQEALGRERAQLDQIRHEQTRRTRTQRLALFSILLLVLLAGAVFLLAIQGFRSLHLERSRFLLATAETLANQKQYDRALRVALLGSKGDWLRRRHPDADAVLGELAYLMPVEAILEGHKDPSAAGFSRDGRRAVTGSEDGTAQVWQRDAAGRWTAFLLEGHEGGILVTDFSPDGSRVVTGSRDSTARVWRQGDDGRWTAAPLVGHQRAIAAASFSEDGRRVVTGSDDQTAWVWREDQEGNWTADVLAGHTGPVGTAIFSADGDSVLTASGDGTARIWQEVGAGRWTSTPLVGHSGILLAASFSDDGRVVTASTDNTARVWQKDAAGHWSSTVLDQHRDFVQAATFSPDGRRILTVSNDRTALVWEQEDQWRADQLLGHVSSLFTASFSSDGRRILTGSADRTARVWQRSFEGRWTTSVLEGHDGAVLAASFSPDGRVWTHSRDRTLRVWRPDTTERWASTLNEGREIHNGAFSPDGRSVLTNDEKTARVSALSPEGRWTTTPLEEVKGKILTAVFTATGPRVLTDEDAPRVWRQDAEGRWVATFLDWHHGGIRSATFSPDGRCLLLESNEDTARVFEQDAEGQWMASPLEGHLGRILRASFSSDGSRLLIGSASSTSGGLWQKDVEGRWRATGLRQDPNQGWFWTASISPDGRRLLTGSERGEVRLWQMDSEDSWTETTLGRHPTTVRAAGFSPDGRRWMTASSDEIRIWRRDNQGRWTYVLLQGPVDEILTFARMSPDGRRVLIGYESGVRVADIRYLSGEIDWAKTESLTRAAAICTEAMGQAVVEPAGADGEPPVILYPLRIVTEADAAAVPAIRDRVGEDVCSEILDPPPWWWALLFWL